MTPLLDPPRPVPATGARAQSTFAPLASAVRSSGYLDRQIGYYVRLACLILGGIGLTAAGVVLLSHSWWALLLAVPAALLSTGCGRCHGRGGLDRGARTSSTRSVRAGRRAGISRRPC